MENSNFLSLLLIVSLFIVDSIFYIFVFNNKKYKKLGFCFVSMTVVIGLAGIVVVGNIVYSMLLEEALKPILSTIFFLNIVLLVVGAFSIPTNASLKSQ